jgi:hypothetical protein
LTPTSLEAEKPVPSVAAPILTSPPAEQKGLLTRQEPRVAPTPVEAAKPMPSVAAPILTNIPTEQKGLLNRLFTSKPAAPTPVVVTPPASGFPVVAPKGSEVPLGMASVVAAEQATEEVVPRQPAPRPGATQVPATQAGAGQPTSPTSQAAGGPNAFSNPPPMPMPAPPTAQVQMGLPAGPPMMAPGMYAPPMPMASVSIDVGTPSGMGNAFTKAGTSRPLPADFGPPVQPGNAFYQGNEMAMASPGGMPPAGMMPATGIPPGMAGTSGVRAVAYEVGASPWQPSLATLRDCLYPSEREWAVEHLSSCNWKSEPVVVQALMTAAKDDPAPTVRAACVRVLGRMKVNTMPVVETVKRLHADPDLRVRQEVEQALPALLAP